MNKFYQIVLIVLIVLGSTACGSANPPAPPASEVSFATVTPSAVQPTDAPQPEPTQPSADNQNALTLPSPTVVVEATSAPNIEPIVEATNTPLPPTIIPQPLVTIPPDPERIEFVSGTSSAQRSGTLAAEGMKAYFVRGLAGQSLTVNVVSEPASNAISVAIYGAGGPSLVPIGTGVTNWTGVLPDSKDYYIEVRSTAADPLNYGLSVALPPLPTPTPIAQAITFPATSTTTLISNEIAPTVRQRYAISAQAGQVLRVSFPEQPTQPFIIGVAVTISDEDGLVLVSDLSYTTRWEGILPRTQSYFIDVVALTESPVRYEMQLELPRGIATPVYTGPERIQFAAGTTGVSINLNLPPQQAKIYVLSARAQQFMSLTYNTDQPVSVSIYGQDGIILRPATDVIARFDGLVPITQDYFIEIRSTTTLPSNLSLNISVQ